MEKSSVTLLFICYLFEGIGRAKVDPIHIHIDKDISPVQQKQRKVALHYKERLKAHLDELKAA